MASFRSFAADVLTELLPDFVVHDHFPAEAPVVFEPTVFIKVDQIAPGPVPAWWELTLTLVLVVGAVEPGVSDDLLDDAAKALLLALDEAPDAVRWSSASRVVVDEKFHGYETTITLILERKS